MGKHFLFVVTLLLLLAAGCVPAGQDSSTGSGTAGPNIVVVEPTTAATAHPPVVVVETAATQTYVPLIEADEPATATPTPDPSATPEPTNTPQPTPTPRTPISSIALETVLPGGLDRPLYLTHAFDERLFVVEQVGVIRIIENGQLLPQPFIDLRDRVGSVGNEQGLLSIAFHPDYKQDGAGGFGKFYVNYTDYQGNTNISRFSVDPSDPNLADKNSEVVLLALEQPYPNHNGGLLKFGPDGYLYAGLGDGGSANDPLNAGQDPGTLLGTILRLDVGDGGEAYSIPPDNPFVDQADRREEIWAWGLRNPWRFSFDAVTGDLYIADVGQNIWEEVNFQPGNSTGGENYGWNIMEGSHCFQSQDCDTTGLVLPIVDYDHSLGCSVTGGYVYRGDAFPEMIGNYFFGDYCSGIIWRLYPTEASGWEAVQVLDSDLVLTSFGEDVNGEIYALDRTNGAVFRLVPER